MTAPASKFRGECPTAPGGLPAPTQTAQAVASDGAAGGAGEVEQGLGPTADGPTVPTVFGGHLLPFVLWASLMLVTFGALCLSAGINYDQRRMMELMRAEREELYMEMEELQQARDRELRAAQVEGYNLGWWDCAIESGRVI